MPEHGSEHGDGKREREIRPADDDKRPSNGLRSPFPELTCQAWAEDEVVHKSAGDQQAYRHELDPQDGVEVAARIVESAVGGGELDARDDRDEHRTPAEHPPTPPERAKGLRPRLAGERARKGNRDEHEHDGAADPDAGREHMGGEEDDVHHAVHDDTAIVSRAVVAPSHDRTRCPPSEDP
jgi:hypothetical protein